MATTSHRMPNQRRQPKATTRVTYITAKLPCVDTICSEEPQSLWYGGAWQVRTDATSQLLKSITLGISMADPTAFLGPLSPTPTLSFNRMDWSQAKKGPVHIEIIKIFLQGFFIATGSTKKGYIECRLQLNHKRDISSIISSMANTTTKVGLSCSFSVDPIQARDLVPIGWLLGSYTPAINLPALTNAIKQQLPPDRAHLDFKLVNQRVHLFRQRTKNKDLPQATHIWGAESHKKELLEVLDEVIYADKAPLDYPLCRPYSVVPIIGDYELVDPGFRDDMLHILYDQAWTHQHSCTLVNDMIASLDTAPTHGAPTLREAIMALPNPAAPDKSLFSAVDHQVTNSSKSVFTFLQKHSDIAKDTIRGLPLIMAAKFGPEAYNQWFTETAKATLQQEILHLLTNSTAGGNTPHHLQQLTKALGFRHTIEWYNLVLRQQSQVYTWLQHHHPPTSLSHSNKLRWVTALVLKQYDVAWDMWQYHLHKAYNQ